MKFDVDVLMNIVMDVLVEMYNSDYDRVKARFEKSWGNIEVLDYDIFLDIIDDELELSNFEWVVLELRFKNYFDNL